MLSQARLIILWRRETRQMPHLWYLGSFDTIHFWVQMLKFSKETFFNEQNFVKENREYIGIYWHKVIAPCQSWVTHESFQFISKVV
jgi:hypothetical protein